MAVVACAIKRLCFPLDHAHELIVFKQKPTWVHWLARSYEPEINQVLNRLFVAIGGAHGMNRIAKQRGLLNIGMHSTAQRDQCLVLSVEETFILASWRAGGRPERSVVLSTNSVSNVAVTCRTPGNFTE
jgi:hypothetical protein